MDDSTRGRALDSAREGQSGEDRRWMRCVVGARERRRCRRVWVVRRWKPGSVRRWTSKDGACKLLTGQDRTGSAKSPPGQRSAEGDADGGEPLGPD